MPHRRWNEYDELFFLACVSGPGTVCLSTQLGKRLVPASWSPCHYPGTSPPFQHNVSSWLLTIMVYCPQSTQTSRFGRNMFDFLNFLLKISVYRRFLWSVLSIAAASEQGQQCQQHKMLIETLLTILLFLRAVAPFRPHAFRLRRRTCNANLLMKCATHGRRNAERNPKALTVSR